MPIDYTHYPATWKAFSLAIRESRAQNRCECMGQCGLHCTHPGPRRCAEVNHMPAQWARGKVVLTVAHICACDPPCAIADHVLACCQRCHLRIDRALHQRHGARTRQATKEAAGQQRLF